MIKKNALQAFWDLGWACRICYVISVIGYATAFLTYRHYFPGPETRILVQVELLATTCAFLFAGVPFTLIFYTLKVIVTGEE